MNIGHNIREEFQFSHTRGHWSPSSNRSPQTCAYICKLSRVCTSVWSRKKYDTCGYMFGGEGRCLAVRDSQRLISIISSALAGAIYMYPLNDKTSHAMADEKNWPGSILEDIR